METAPAVHKINWYKVSRDPMRMRTLKSVLRKILATRFPRTNLLIDDEKVFLLYIKKRSKRRIKEGDHEELRKFLYKYVIPEHLKRWIEKHGPEELLSQLL